MHCQPLNGCGRKVRKNGIDGGHLRRDTRHQEPQLVSDRGDDRRRHRLTPDPQPQPLPVPLERGQQALPPVELLDHSQTRPNRRGVVHGGDSTSDAGADSGGSGGGGSAARRGHQLV